MTPHPQPLLDIRHHPDGSVVIKRYPFETVFNMDEWKELLEYCVTHSSQQSERDKVLDEPEGNNLHFAFTPEPVGGNSRIYIHFSDADCFSIEITDLELENLRTQLTDFIKLRQEGKHD